MMPTTRSLTRVTRYALVGLAATSMNVRALAPQAEPFGQTADGKEVKVFTLSNGQGLKLRAMSYGAIVLSLETPDRDGKSADIVLGYKTLGEYIKDTPYFGAVVGRALGALAGAAIVTMMM